MLTPTGRDAEVVASVLGARGISVVVCADMERLCGALEEGAGAILLAEEVLTSAAASRLVRALRAQPAWSDIPLIMAVPADRNEHARFRAMSAIGPAANVHILERPGRVLTMIVAVQAALRARRRQCEMRALLRQQEQQLEQLRAERELRARFVSLLAHDLRGPLSAAILAANVLAGDSGSGDRRRDTLARLDRNLGRIEKMLRDLLDVSRLHAGQPLRLELEDCDIVQLAREVAEDLVAVHGPRVVVDSAAGSTRGSWSADELRRAIWNLAENGLKYGAPESIVTISVDGDEAWVRLSVHNLGTPLSSEDMQRMFEPFAQLRGNTPASAGWGLGLTLVRGCAEAHGGRVCVSSAVEAGNTFTMHLPRAVPVVADGSPTTVHRDRPDSGPGGSPFHEQP